MKWTRSQEEEWKSWWTAFQVILANRTDIDVTDNNFVEYLYYSSCTGGSRFADVRYYAVILL